MTVVQSTAVLPERAPSLAHDASRIPALDGLRGLAVMAVMLHHFCSVQPKTALVSALSPITHYGWTGVDLFFVLSGFLITGILADAKGSAHYFRNFYARRTVRIFPLYYAVLVLALVIIPMFSSPLINRFGQTQQPAWYWLYLSNFDMALRGYQNKILAVSWSLAIEEQFYLVWPTVILLFTRRTVIRICAGLIGLAIVTRVALGIYQSTGATVFHADAGYWLTFCRMDSIALGSMLALLMRARSLAWLAERARFVLVVTIVLLAVITAPGGKIEEWGNTAIGFTLVALVAGSLLILALSAPRKSLAGQFFSSRPLRMFGKYSYALYLFHYPIAIVLAGMFREDRFPSLANSYLGQSVFILVATAISLGVALLSWNIYEKQFLKLKDYFPMGEAKAGALATGN